MQRTRTLTGTPARTSSASWQALVDLLSSSLERSDDVPFGSVVAALDPFRGLAAALLSSVGNTSPFVLIDADIYVTFYFENGDASFKSVESSDPVPGTARATKDWVLFLPVSAPLANAISAQVSASTHIAAGPAPDYVEKSANFRETASAIDFEALRARGN